MAALMWSWRSCLYHFCRPQASGAQDYARQEQEHAMVTLMQNTVQLAELVARWRRVAIEELYRTNVFAGDEKTVCSG